MEYISAKQAAGKWGICVRQVQNYCRNGEIMAAERISGVWAIPADAAKPVDRRRLTAEKAGLAKAAFSACSLAEGSVDAGLVFKKIADHFPYRINVSDTEGFLVYGNDAFFEGTLPEVREAALGRYNIFQEASLAEWGLTEHIRRAFRGEQVYTPDLRFPNKELVGSKYGSEYAFFSLYNDVSSFPIHGQDGRLKYVVTVFIPVRKYMARDEIMRAKEYMDAHLTEPFRTQLVAQAVNLSVTSFVQSFKKETGMTPHNYYIQSRMKRLRDTLLHSNLSVAQAFDVCGMEYNSYYTALFKRNFGMTPKQFREQGK